MVGLTYRDLPWHSRKFHQMFLGHFLGSSNFPLRKITTNLLESMGNFTRDCPLWNSQFAPQNGCLKMEDKENPNLNAFKWKITFLRIGRTHLCENIRHTLVTILFHIPKRGKSFFDPKFQSLKSFYTLDFFVIFFSDRTILNHHDCPPFGGNILGSSSKHRGQANPSLPLEIYLIGPDSLIKMVGWPSTKKDDLVSPS